MSRPDRPSLLWEKAKEYFLCCGFPILPQCFLVVNRTPLPNAVLQTALQLKFLARLRQGFLGEEPPASRYIPLRSPVFLVWKVVIELSKELKLPSVMFNQ